MDTFDQMNFTPSADGTLDNMKYGGIDVSEIVQYGRMKINSQYNEISPALSIFDKHWDGLSEANRTVIWKYLKVLISLSEKSVSVRV